MGPEACVGRHELDLHRWMHSVHHSFLLLADASGAHGHQSSCWYRSLASTHVPGRDRPRCSPLIIRGALRL